MQDWSGAALQTTTADITSSIDLDNLLDTREQKDPNRRLWLESLQQSIEMLKGRVPWPLGGHNKDYGYRELYRQQERSWWLSQNTGPGSCRWVCQMLSLNRGMLVLRLRQEGLL